MNVRFFLNLRKTSKPVLTLQKNTLTTVEKVSILSPGKHFQLLGLTKDATVNDAFNRFSEMYTTKFQNEKILNESKRAELDSLKNAYNQAVLDITTGVENHSGDFTTPSDSDAFYEYVGRENILNRAIPGKFYFQLALIGMLVTVMLGILKRIIFVIKKYSTYAFTSQPETYIEPKTAK